MRKTFILFLTALLCVGNLFADTKRVYCKMTYSWWTDASAAVGIYSFKSATSAAAWPGVRMTRVQGEADVWYADVDVTTYPSVIFTRVNGSGDIEYWGAQTEDLTIPTDGKNLYTITSSSAQWSDKGNKCTGTWSTYTPPTTLPTYYITGNANLVGEGVTAWAVDAIKLGEATATAPATYTFKTLPADTCCLKITNGTWKLYYGYSDLDTEKSSANILNDNDGNIVFVPKEANKEVKLTFDGTKIILEGEFAAPTTLTTYYITGNANVVGTDVTEWAVDAIKLGEATADNPANYTFSTLPADTCRLKITNGTWDKYFGYSSLDADNSSANILNDEKGNIVFVPKEAKSEVKLTFDGTKITLTGEFAAPAPVKNVTAYYVNKDNWEKVYAYVYTDGNNNTWPGAEMTKTDIKVNGFDIYSYEFAETYTTIIFNNGKDKTDGGSQTDDLTVDATKPYYYDGTWYATTDDIPTLCTAEYGIMVGSEFKAFAANPEKAGEYMLTNVLLKNADTFTLYQTCVEKEWTVALKDGSTDKVTIAEGKYVAGADGYYDFYFTPSYENDVLYISYVGTTPTSVVTILPLDRTAPMYNILGQQVDATYRGVVFQNGTKFLLQ